MTVSPLVARFGINALFLTLCYGARPAESHAQEQRVLAGDLLKIRTRVYSNVPTLRGMRPLVSGRLEGVRGDSLYIQPSRSDSIVPFPTSILESPNYSVEVQRGTKAASWAVQGFGGAGLAGFALGYCFQLFSDECAADFTAGLMVGTVLGAAGGLVGLLIGSIVDRYEPVDPDVVLTGVVPQIDQRGRIGLRGQIALPPH